MTEENRDAQRNNRIARIHRYRVHIAAAALAAMLSGLVTLAWLTSRPKAIAVTTARAVKHTAIFSIYRTVYVLPTPDVVIKPEQAGWVLDTRVRTGEHVRAGQVVATLQQADNGNDRAVAAFDAAQQNLQIARTDVTAAQGNVEAGESALRLREQRLSQAQNALAVARAAERQADVDARTAELTLQKYSASIGDNRDMFSQGIISRQELQRDESALEQARRQVEQIAKSVEVARSNVESVMNLIVQQQRSVEQTRARLSKFRTALVSARKDASKQESVVRQARAALESAKRSEKILPLRSPVDGIVSGVAVKAGCLATSSSGVLLIKPLNTATVAFDTTDAEVSRLKVGMSVLVQRARNTRPLPGAVASIPVITDGGIKSRRVLIKAQNPAGSLKPGNRVVAQVILRKASAVVIPSSAVMQSKNGAIVWIVNNGQAKSVRITLVNSQRGTSIVQGIHAGDSVVVRTTGPLREDARVEMASSGQSADR